MVQFQKFVYGAILSLIIGWVLYIGKDVFIPVAFGAVVVYIDDRPLSTHAPHNDNSPGSDVLGERL